MALKQQSLHLLSIKMDSLILRVKRSECPSNRACWRPGLLAVGCQYYLHIGVCLQDFLKQITYLYLLIPSEVKTLTAYG